MDLPTDDGFYQSVLSWMPRNIKVSNLDLISDPKEFFSIDWEHCFLTVAFDIATVVELSQCNIVGGWLWPSPFMISCSVVPS